MRFIVHSFLELLLKMINKARGSIERVEEIKKATYAALNFSLRNNPYCDLLLQT